MADLGALAGGFLQAFAQSRRAKQQDEQAKKEKDILTKLAEIQLENEETRQAAMGRVSELLTGKRPSADVGLMDPQSGEIESNVIPRRNERPMSVTDLLSDPEGFLAASQSGQLPNLQEADQFAARSELAQTLQGGSSINDPESMGLAVRSGMQLPQQSTRVPDSVAITRSVGLDPATDEGRQFIERLEMQDENVIQALQAQVGLQQAQLDLREQMNDLERQQQGEAEAVVDVVEASRTIAKSLDVLEGSFLEPGVPATDLRQSVFSAASFASRLTGIGDPEKMEEVLTAYGDFSKATSDLVNQVLNRMAQHQTITNTARDNVKESLANAGLNPAANRNVLVRVLNDALRDAERLQLSDSEKSEIKSVLAQVERKDGDGKDGGSQRLRYDPKTGKLVPK